MDTSILDALTLAAPDLMEAIELRMLVLERVSALGPIGRRALAARLHLAEREVRSAADALKGAGMLAGGASGMVVTGEGRAMVEMARAVSRGRRTLAVTEAALAQKLGVARVCVVHGDAESDERVLEETARAAARQMRLLLQDARVLAVTGGRTIALTAESIAPGAPMDVCVVPAQGGFAGDVRTQANTLAEAFARRLGGRHRMLHLPDGLTGVAADELCRLPQLRETLDMARRADVVLYGIGRAQELMARRGVSAAERERMMAEGAVAEALGFYFDAKGRVVGGSSLVVDIAEIGHGSRAAIVAAGAGKAEAIIAVCLHHPHALLVTDEGAANRMLELMRA